MVVNLIFLFLDDPGRDGLAHRGFGKFPVGFYKLGPSHQNLTKKLSRVIFFCGGACLTLLPIFKDRMKEKMLFFKKLVSRYGQSGHVCIFVCCLYYFLSELTN